MTSRVDQNMIVLEPPERLALVATMREELGRFTTQYGMELMVMSIGPDGYRWLDEHAVGWRDHVGLVQFKVKHEIPDDQMVRSRGAALKSMMNEMTQALATKMVETMEPLMKEADLDG